MLLIGQIVSYKAFLNILGLYEIVLYLLRQKFLQDLAALVKAKWQNDTSKELIILTDSGMINAHLQGIPARTIKRRDMERFSADPANIFPSNVSNIIVFDDGLLSTLRPAQYEMMSRVLENIPPTQLFINSSQIYSLLSWVSPFSIPVRCFWYHPPTQDFVVALSNPIWTVYEMMVNFIVSSVPDGKLPVNVDLVKGGVRCALFGTSLYLIKWLLM